MEIIDPSENKSSSLILIHKLSIVLWLQVRWYDYNFFLEDLDITTPTSIYVCGDNQDGIFIVGNLAFHERIRH